jgi:hypothetical protein
MQSKAVELLLFSDQIHLCPDSGRLATGRDQYPRILALLSAVIALTPARD